MKVTLYTDGACKGNPGPGGWGAFLQWGAHEKRLCGGVENTTNNRMELTAAIQGLRALNRSSEVDLWTDSVYVKDGITKWMANWKANGWRTAAKKPVANQDLWQALADEVERHTVHWHWVKGHAGHPGNELADQLANQGVEQCVRSS